MHDLSPPDLTRRRFLAATGGLVLAAGLPVARGQSRAAVPIARGGRFAQSVASGQPTERGITLWTKLSELEQPGRLQFEIAKEPDFRSIVMRRSVVADPASDLSITTRVDSSRLDPAERYYYRFYTCDQSSPIGRFKTALPAGSQAPVRIGFFSCQDYESGFYTAHAGLAEEDDLDLVVCLGDYIYEKSYDSSPLRKDTTGANRDADVQTLAEYRDKYRLYHSDPAILQMRATHPLLVVWDDHEVEDNYAADKPGDGTKNKRVPFAERRANGYRAFFEHMPRARLGGDPDRIYGRVPLGANAEVLLLDQRQYRSDQPCGDPRAQPCPEASEPGRTLLGAEQKAWLKDALTSSRARWKIIANQVMVMSLDVARDQPLGYDSWDGYVAERRELGDFIRDRGVQDVTFVSGDIHTFFAGTVTPSGREGVGEPAPVATEFVGGAITSKGIADQAGEGPSGAVAIPVDAVVPTQNPHIKYSNQAFKGYGVLEARPDELLVQFKAPRTIASPTSAIMTLQRFRVPRGKPEVEVLGAG